jgi:hypothetical protein
MEEGAGAMRNPVHPPAARQGQATLRVVDERIDLIEGEYTPWSRSPSKPLSASR